MKIREQCVKSVKVKNKDAWRCSGVVIINCEQVGDFFKSYLHCKTITPQSVPFEAQVKDFLIP